VEDLILKCIITPLGDSITSRVANLALLKPDFEILFFLNTFAFFEDKKIQTKSGFFLAFFQSERLGSGKTLSKLHIHYKSLLKRVYNQAGCTEKWKNFTVALKMINFIDKKQMYDSVTTEKENASKERNYIISLFLTSFNVYFAFAYACFMCICPKTPLWLFLGQGLDFFGENRLATLVTTENSRQDSSSLNEKNLFLCLQTYLICQSDVWKFCKNGFHSSLESLIVTPVESSHSAKTWLESSQGTTVSRRDSSRITINRDSSRVIDSSHGFTSDFERFYLKLTNFFTTKCLIQNFCRV